MIVSRTVFQVFGPQETSAFIDSQEHQALDEFARSLPLAVRAHGLEFKLAAGAEHADYLVCLEAEPDCVASVRALLETRRSQPRSGVEQFLARWALDSDDAMRVEFPILWLEWDRPQGLATHDPALFIAPARALNHDSARRELARSFELLYGADLVVQQQRVVDRVVSALPAGARLRHLGAMPARHSALLRVVLEGVAASVLPELLRQLGWAGNYAHLTQLLTEIEAATGATPARIDLDCCDEPNGNLGLEFLLSGVRKPTDNGAALLEYLQSHALCDQTKAASLRRWLNWSRVAAAEIAPHCFWQKLYHFKLTLKGAGRDQCPAMTAKAYWGVWAGPNERTLGAVHSAIKQTFVGDVA